MDTDAKYDLILQNIQRYVDLDNQAKSDFLTIIRSSNVKKRQFIVQPNFTCTHPTYVAKGAFRSYFVSEDGVDHTIQFAIDDWFISDFNSYISQAPASLYVEALEDSSILQLAFEDVEDLCSKHVGFERFFRLVAQKSFAFSQRRILSNLGKTAEERYLEFLQMYPQIIERVPQYALASYLGMTPEFLSKIRKKLASKS